MVNYFIKMGTIIHEHFCRKIFNGLSRIKFLVVKGLIAHNKLYNITQSYSIIPKFEQFDHNFENKNILILHLPLVLLIGRLITIILRENLINLRTFFIVIKHFKEKKLK
jgi:hypothetical protein